MVLLLVVVVVVDVAYLRWHSGGGSDGDSLCKGGSCNSFRSAIVKSMMCHECVGLGGGEGCGYGVCGGVVGGGVIVGGDGQ